MKKTITQLTIGLSIIASTFQAQTINDFESLALPTNTFYAHNATTYWQANNAEFKYVWDSQYNLWDSGFSYTNLNDSTNGTYTNLYGAITYKGYNNSNKYVTASQGYFGENMIIKLAPTQASVLGFYVTNTTYAYKTMKSGGGPARAFGDTLNTNSGMQPGNYPDWFKLSVYGYKNGIKKTDTVEFYLADYRFADNTQDYIVKNWQWVDCTALGGVDSISFKLYSSDFGVYGINNPTYFSMDNFTTSLSVGVNELELVSNTFLFPNPTAGNINLNFTTQAQSSLNINVKDVTGKILISSEHHSTIGENNCLIETNSLAAGVYFIEVSGSEVLKRIKFIKL